MQHFHWHFTAKRSRRGVRKNKAPLIGAQEMKKMEYSIWLKVKIWKQELGEDLGTEDSPMLARR
jgi:hypothetical protein